MNENSLKVFRDFLFQNCVNVVTERRLEKSMMFDEDWMFFKISLNPPEKT